MKTYTVKMSDGSIYAVTAVRLEHVNGFVVFVDAEGVLASFNYSHVVCVQRTSKD